MLNKILFLVAIYVVYSFVHRNTRRIHSRLNKIKYIDHDMENKTIYDKFEYYSIIGDEEKQMEYLWKILNQTKI